MDLGGYRLRGRCATCDGPVTVHRAEVADRPGRLVRLTRLAAPATGAQTEIETARTITAWQAVRHAALLPVESVGHEPGMLLLQGPAASARPLDTLGAPAPTGDPAVVAELGELLASGLAALHAHGQAHGAVSRHTILLTTDGAAVLDGPWHAACQEDGQDRDPVADVRALATTLLGLLPDPDGTGLRSMLEGHRDTPGDAASLQRDLSAWSMSAASSLPHRGSARAADRSVEDPPDQTVPQHTDAPRAGGTSSSGDTPDPTVPQHTDTPRAGGTTSSGDTPDPTHHLDTSSSGDTPDPTHHLDTRRVRHHHTRRSRRTASIGVAAGVATVVLAVALSGARTPPAADLTHPTPATATDPAPDPAPVSGSTEGPVGRRAASPVCTGMAVPPGAGRLVLADLDGRGCRAPVRVDGSRVASLGSDGTLTEVVLDLDPGDQVRFADLDAAGQDELVVYRPRTGEIFRFAGLAEPGGVVTAPGQASGWRGGTIVVVPAAHGGHRLEVRGGHRREARGSNTG